MTPSGPVRTAAGLAGAAAVALSAVLVVAPGTSTALLPVEAVAASTALSAGDARAAAIGAVGVACLLWVAWTSGGARAVGSAAPADGDGTAAPMPSPDAPDDAAFPTLDGDDAGAVDRATAATAFDRRLAETVAAAERGDGVDDVRADVRSLAIDVVAHAAGCSREAAADRVDQGVWTDDVVAAAYVADREAALPLGVWLRGWVRPGATKVERVHRSIRAVEARLDDRDGTVGQETVGEDAPPSDTSTDGPPSTDAASADGERATDGGETA